MALSSVVLLRQSSPWMLRKAPLQEEVGSGHRKVGGKSCLDGPTSLFRVGPCHLSFLALELQQKQGNALFIALLHIHTHTLSLSLFGTF